MYCSEIDFYLCMVEYALYIKLDYSQGCCHWVGIMQSFGNTHLLFHDIIVIYSYVILCCKSLIMLGVPILSFFFCPCCYTFCIVLFFLIFLIFYFVYCLVFHNSTSLFCFVILFLYDNNNCVTVVSLKIRCPNFVNK